MRSWREIDFLVKRFVSRFTYFALAVLCHQGQLQESDLGDRNPKTYESYFIHYNFVQLYN